MNLGSEASKALSRQQPTYHLAPNFTTRPSPHGPFDLGTLVEDVQQYYPLNQGVNNRVQIPPEQLYTDSKEDVNSSLKTSRSGEASILAKILDHSIGGEASLKGQRTDEDVYTIQKLETRYFYPQPSYIKRCLQLSDVRDYLDMADYKAPVYLITGLKLAWGATVSTTRNRGYEGGAEGDLTVPGAPVDVNVGAKVGVAGDSTRSSSFGKPADFVLGIQVQKLYHKRKFLSGDRVLTASKVMKGAVLVDDDEIEVEDTDADDNFVAVTLEDAEVEGLVPWINEVPDGQDEKWFIPSGIL